VWEVGSYLEEEGEEAMKGTIKMVFYGVLPVLLLAFVVWWSVYKFKDCRKVGHSMTYCVLRILD
jgi:Na+/H+ antiporter NhaC